MTRVLIFGAGRMARALLSLQGEFPGVSFVALVSRHQPGSEDLPALIPFYSSMQEAWKGLSSPPDLVMDFSLNDATPTVADWCGKHGVGLLSGVTGIDSQAHRALDDASKAVPVLWAPNLSHGINVLARLLREAALMIGEHAQITIEETHHRGKKDAPSGTALYLADQFGGGREVDLVSHREGDVAGEHEVRIELVDECLTFAHSAQHRRLFARGALRAAIWLAGQPAGRYSADDWIGGMKESSDPGANGQA